MPAGMASGYYGGHPGWVDSDTVLSDYVTRPYELPCVDDRPPPAIVSLALGGGYGPVIG